MSIIRDVSRCAIVALAIGLSSQGAHASWDGFEGKIKGWKVIASQIALAAKTKNNAAQRIAQATMSARSTLSSFVNQLELYQGYGPLSGQGVNVCDAVNQRDDIVAIANRMPQYDVGNVASGGRLDLPKTQYAVAKTEIMLDKFCSAEEHNLGICRASYDGAGAYARDFSMFSQSEQLTHKQVDALNLFVANVVGDKPQFARRAGACTGACLQAQRNQDMANSSASMAAYGLSMSLADRVGEKSYAPLKTGAQQ